ncbi:RNA polymerase sigma factor [Ilumatobacter coccineus]|uniref:Putative RNA polymerase ECF subfamily sigma factor n=1 Tax=Ilumatobacter coccineus (strain NBRC 103263 / KCTC 29153 / YM16-304) TaxID=1313172 RepID=A0A6C7E9F8_ILUCY|nr:sigma-70 family RNA polymerase sigma factor [Ilumatobacter coccineus]BAN01238.1 putative RNA polymerase ECF subfamily sigma factor [Ilumatobacter coccineus YM16-304]
MTQATPSNLDSEAPAPDRAARTHADLDVTLDFEEFYRRQHARVERALTLSLGSVETGQDAAAEGFARALARWDRVSGFANPTGWVFRVGVNWARSRRRRRRREVSPDEFARLAIDTASTDDVHTDQAVVDALGRLSFEHRVVVVARYYLDWSEADLAAALDIPTGTVKSRTSRALQQLSTILEDDQ